MDTVNKEFLLNHGFSEFSKNDLKEYLKCRVGIIKKINMTVFISIPSMIISKTKVKNVFVDEFDLVENNRFVIKKNKKVILDIPIENIENCLYKSYSTGIEQFEFEINRLRYSLDLST